jgi:starch synthase
MGTTGALLPVLSVASELFPLVKTGGLADVAGALPQALAPFGVAMRTLLPGYPAVMDALVDAEVVVDWPGWSGGPARLLAARHGDLDLFVLDAPHLYARPGNPYLGPDGRDWPDNAERFAALAAAAARIGLGDVPSFAPAVIHVHDWQAALVPAYLRFGADAARHPHRAPATVLTIHNLAFQGRFGADVLARIGFPPDAFRPDALEYFGDVGYLKAGILMADAITTVSPTYAREIRTPADGMGMDAMLRWRGNAVHGIVNGIDTTVWDPATDAALAATYDRDRLDDRIANKRAVEADFDLPPADGPLVCMITRLTTQKGIDLVIDALDAIVALGVRLVVLGSGDRVFEAALRAAHVRWPDRIGVKIAYDDALSHRMQGGCDAILIPSRFEPCGLTQLYGLRYGCVPLVARVGGLADTIVDANDAAVKAGVATGFQFEARSGDDVTAALVRCVEQYEQPDDWRALQRAGMGADVSWTASAAAYAVVYRGLLD